MEKRSKNRDTGMRMALISMVFVLAFIGILLAYYSMLYSQTREKIIKSQELIAVQEAEQIDQYLDSGIYTMRFACFTLDNMLRSGRSQKEIEEFILSESEAIVNILSENSEGLYAYINGEFIDGSGWVPYSGFDPVQRPWYIDARANIGRVAIVDPYFDVESQTMTISLAKTLCDAKSVVGMDFSLEYMQELTEALYEQNNTDIEMVLDQDYTVITHSDPEERGKNYLSESDSFGRALAEKLRSTEDSQFSLHYNGAEYIVYRVSVANDWLCISVFDATTVFSQMKKMLVFTILAICLVVAVSVLIMRVLRQRTQIAEQLENDIQEKDDLIKKISVNAFRDPLTGVRNKAAQQKYMNDFTEKIHKGMQEPFAVIMMDVNNLKYVNDNFGHEKGDRYLRGCCLVLCNLFKNSPVFRLGGDEFMTVLQDKDYENREHQFAELKRAFAQADAQKDKEAWERFSASVGMADYTDEDDSADAVIRRADQEMYQDKKLFKEKNGSYR